MTTNLTTNAFLSLCQLASRKNWCWNLYCSTCHHSNFRNSFKALIEGRHPSDRYWIINNEHLSLRPFSANEQKVLADIVLGASIAEIMNVSKFPDWLGYLGLVLTYCPYEAKRLGVAWAPQFQSLLPEDSIAYDIMTSILTGAHQMCISDLEDIEIALNKFQ